MAQAFWIPLCLLLIFNALYLAAETDDENYRVDCDKFWNTTKIGSEKECEAIKYKRSMLMNLLQIDSAYCFNNGSGICKAVIGRFEFLFNVFEDKVIGPVGPSEHVNNFGHHKRVPRVYDIDGRILYHDRSINWARSFKKSIGESKINLLSSNEFNWCSYVKKGWWPYKSAIKDSPKDSKYEIYFYNRQSCILNPERNLSQHFNTRFLHNSSNRIDLDMNPTIFAMEDNEAKEIRLVKHKRQHWYEVKYRVIEKPTPDITYFVSMDNNQTEPCIITGKDGRHILSRNAYRKFTNKCLSDDLFERHGKNSKLLDGCGNEQTEIADIPIVTEANYIPYEVHLHNIPRGERDLMDFYGVDIATDEDWETFAKDGFVFSATTTIPISGSNDKVRVIMLYAFYKATKDITTYEEHYPLPYFSDYTAIYNKAKATWDLSDRAKKQKPVKNLNYVDDIAYLYQCKTVLIIFGPLYSEVPADKFSLQSKAPLDSIYELGMWELTNAFFAMPDGSDTLWAYHRLNYIASYKYTCAKGSGKLVTAVKSSKYHMRNTAQPQHPFIVPNPGNPIETVDETFMKLVEVYKGNYEPREPPNPDDYPLGNDELPDPKDPKDHTWLYILIGVGILLITAMCIICLVTFRRRRKRQHVDKHSLAPSARSGMSGHTGMSHKPTRRSSMSSSHASSKKTGRSSLKKGASKPNSNSSSARTARSSMRSGSHRPSSRSHSKGSAGTRRSSLPKGSSRPSSQSSQSKSSRSSAKSGSSAKGK